MGGQRKKVMEMICSRAYSYMPSEESDVIELRSRLERVESVVKTDIFPEIQDEDHIFFYLDEGLFALHCKLVEKIVEFKHIFKVPFSPDFVAGVINYHGELVTVLDLVELWRHEKGVMEPNLVIVLKSGERMLAFCADKVVNGKVYVAGFNKEVGEKKGDIFVDTSIFFGKDKVVHVNADLLFEDGALEGLIKE
ncbi:MAG: chemotaxis protein CheW [Gammaproteobacteria bacterium]|nr:chemotaxis protein CheW [Gammaproteobacteria bacterium]